MENKSHAFWTGVFTLVLLVAMVAALFWFNRDTVLRLPYDIVTEQSVTGLGRGAVVRYRGLAVGRVNSIEFDPAVRGRIIIHIGVDPRAPISHSTYAAISFQGVTGQAFLQLDDAGSDRTPLSTSSANVAQIPLRSGLINQLQQRGEALLGQFEVISKELQVLLNDDSRRQLLATAKSLEQAANGVNGLTREAAPVVRQLPATLDQLNRTLVATQGLANDLRRPDGPWMSNLNRIGIAAERAGTALMGLNGTMTNMTARITYETLPRIDALSDEMRSSSRAVDRAADTVGRNPRSLLFGASPPAPGPGEAGFVWPAAPADAPSQ